MEREEKRRVAVKRRCVNPFSSDAFEEFSPVDDSGSCGDSWSDLLGDSCGLSKSMPAVSSGLPVVTDVSDSTTSVGVPGEALRSGSGCEMVEPQSISLLRKRQAFCVKGQENMNYDGTPAKAHPASTRKVMSPTPQQGLPPSIEAMQLHMEVEDQGNCICRIEYGGEHRWTARDRVVIARMEQYLDESDSLKVEVEELELLLGPEDSDVDLRHILMYARKKRVARSLTFFTSKVPSEFFVASVKGCW